MTEVAQAGGYLQRYTQKQGREQAKSVGKASPVVEGKEDRLGSVVGRLEERVDGIDVKLTSLVNVVRLLQRYTETKDDQYEKERENAHSYQGK